MVSGSGVFGKAEGTDAIDAKTFFVQPRACP